MENQDIREFIKKTIEVNLGKTIIDMNQNLFDDFAAYEVLYVIEPIEKCFNISIKDIICKSDYTVMTINNLTKKIEEILDDKVGNY